VRRPFFVERQIEEACPDPAGTCGGVRFTKGETGMSKSSQRGALRLAGLGAALALLLGACGEQAPEGEQQQGSVSPPAVTGQLASAAATT
jgi:hypothetical protein